MGVLGGIAYAALVLLRPLDRENGDLLSHTVQLRTIRDGVVERGTLESQSTINGFCELPGWEHKIIFIVPEGSQVEKGDVVVRIDSSKIDEQIKKQKSTVNENRGQLAQAEEELEVQKNKNESDIAAAELDLALTKLDLSKYSEGDYIAELADYERSILEGEAELEKIRDELENMRILVKKGFRAPEQLRELELRERSAKFRVDRDKQKMEVLKQYDHKRKITEFEAKAKEADRKLIRTNKTAEAEVRKLESKIQQAKSALELEENNLKELEALLEKSEIKAPQPGTVAYANKPWYDDSERIREGATVRQRQDIFYLPDMSRMQVAVNVHESVVNKVKKDQKVSVRIDAFPEMVFDGTVERVAQLANSGWNASTKNYRVIVTIDSIPEGILLKPGMTAETEILVGTYENIIAVPVNTLTEHFQQTYAYLINGKGVERQRVKTGRSTTSFVEVTEGIDIGDKLALDAYQRGLADFGEAERQAEETKKSEAAVGEAASGGAAVGEGSPPANAAPPAGPAG